MEIKENLNLVEISENEIDKIEGGVSGGTVLAGVLTTAMGVCECSMANWVGGVPTIYYGLVTIGAGLY